MNRILSFLMIVAIGLAISSPVFAQILVEDGAPAPVAPAYKAKVGKSAATDYFKKRELAQEGSSESSAGGSSVSVSDSDRVLGIHVGTFLNDKAYRWGRSARVEDPGKGMLGVTYRVGEWTKSMDLYFRAELMNYEIDDERPLKLSVMPIIAFPDVRSDFPLYFGGGAGAGIFFKQAGDESDLSFDYALLVGARFPTLFEWGGLFVETGLKGQVHLFSSGQHDGVFIAVGSLFTF